MRNFVYEALPGRVVFGAGASREKLAPEVERLGARRVLLLATEGKRALAEELAGPLGGRVAGIFTGVRPHVPLEVAEAARETARGVGAREAELLAEHPVGGEARGEPVARGLLGVDAGRHVAVERTLLVELDLQGVAGRLCRRCLRVEGAAPSGLTAEGPAPPASRPCRPAEPQGSRASPRAGRPAAEGSTGARSNPGCAP